MADVHLTDICRGWPTRLAAIPPVAVDLRAFRVPHLFKISASLDAFRALMSATGRQWASLDWPKIDVDPRCLEVVTRYGVATETLAKDNPTRRAWEAVGSLTPGRLLPLLPLLPNPLNRRGRPGGTQALDDGMRAALTDADQKGEPLTTAAKRVLAGRGVPDDQIKSKADYAVRTYGRR